jgi:polyisoprenoid-binding protein YceI
MKLLLLPLFALFSLPAMAAQTLDIDSNHSAVVFSWSHHGYSNPVARFEKIEGKLMLDERDLSKSSVMVTLPVAALHTGVAALDKRLKTAEFFDEMKYPEITFKSTKVEKGPMDSLKISGNLSMHGVTKLVTLDGKINRITIDAETKTNKAGFDASVTLRRSDFGVDKYLPAVAEEVLVRITLDAYSEG